MKQFLAIFKQRLIDVFIQEWTSAIRDSDRYDLYRSFKDTFKQEHYLLSVNTFCFRVALSQTRLSVLPLNNNIYRYSENPRDRICTYCKKYVENVHHLVYSCSLYTDFVSVIKDYKQLCSGVTVEVRPVKRGPAR